MHNLLQICQLWELKALFIKEHRSKDSVFIFVLPDRDYFARSIRARNNERSQSS